MSALLALASAACYGIADVGGGLLSRRADAVVVALAAQVGALLVTLPAAWILPSSAVAATDLLWGGLSGVGTGVGMTFLFRGLSRGHLSVVVPLVAVGGVAIPVLVGVSLLGDRPSALAWVGILLAGPSLWLLLASTPGDRAAISGPRLDGLLSSVGIAVQYLALAQAGSGAGIWPVAAGRVTAVATVVPFAMATTRTLRLPGRIWVEAVGVGGLSALALSLYLVATRDGLLTVTVVLASLYPVVPVLFGIAFLGERLTRRRLGGLSIGMVAVVLLALP